MKKVKILYSKTKHFPVASLLLLLILSGFKSNAQPVAPSCPCTNTLGMNTGYDYVVGTKIASPGGIDPRWKVIGFHSLFQVCFEPPASPAFPSTPFQAEFFPGASPVRPDGTWLSYDPSNWLPLPTGCGCNYSTIYAKEFEPCSDFNGTLNYSFDINRDNWVESVKLAGVTIYTGEPATNIVSNYDGSSPLHISGSMTVSLSYQTSYLLEVEIGNYEGVTNNPTGFELWGNISGPALRSCH